MIEVLYFIKLNLYVKLDKIKPFTFKFKMILILLNCKTNQHVKGYIWNCDSGYSLKCFLFRNILK
jgi:hypothetical protein